MNRTHRLLGLLSKAGVVFAGILLASAPRAAGCALCADYPGASGTLDPRLLELAAAIQHEIDSGGLDRRPSAPLPTSGRGLGLRMNRILSAHPEWNRSFELLLIDSGARFHFRLSQAERGFVPVSEKDKSPPPPLRWITGLDVFHALLDGSLPMDTAAIRGVLVIEDIPKGVDELSTSESLADSSTTPTPDKRLAPWVLPSVLGALILLPIMLAVRTTRVHQGRASTSAG